MAAIDHQVGGEHYKKLAIQPIEYILRNNLNFAQGSIIKYVTRYKDKGGVEDLKKARHMIDFLIEFEYGRSATIDEKREIGKAIWKQ